MNIFERATRKKWRFPTNKGQCTVEDLWDLSVQQLDNIFKELSRTKTSYSEESLLNGVNVRGKKLSAQIEIVRHIVATKLAEKEAAEKALEKRAKKEQILALVEQKRIQGLAEMSEEELLAMAEEL